MSHNYIGALPRLSGLLVASRSDPMPDRVQTYHGNTESAYV